MSGKEKLPRANLEQKIMILNYHHHSGKPQSETVEYYKNQFAISTSSFSEWLKNEKDLRIRYNDAQSASSDLSNHMKHQKRKSKFKYDAINKAMHDLVENRRSQHLPINEPILREHWAVFARKFGVDDPKRLQSFSHGWLSQFKKRNGLDRKSMSVGFRYVTRENGEKEMVVDDGDDDDDDGDQSNVTNNHGDNSINDNNPNNNLNDSNKIIPTNSSMNKQSNYSEIVMISSDNQQQNNSNNNKINSHDRNGVNNLLNQNSNNNNINNNTSVVGNNQDSGPGAPVNLINSVKPVQSLQESQQELDQQHVQQQQIQHQQHVQQQQHIQQQQQQPVHQQINNGYSYNRYPNSSLPSINQQMQVQQQQQQQQQLIPSSSVPSQSSAQSSAVPTSTSTNATTATATAATSAGPPGLLGALDVGDMERFIYMWADKFFMDFSSDFPRSKDIFDQFKHKFFEERLMYNQRLASQQANNSVDDFFLRRAR